MQPTRFSNTPPPRLALILALILALTRLACLAEATEWQRGVIRINSTVSAGSKTLFEIADDAVSKDLDFIVFSDQLVARGEYGVWPLPHVFRVWRTHPSISTYGVKNYLADIDRIRSAHENLVVIAGADVAPVYTWYGTPLTDDFTVRRWSEQLTVFGSDDPAFYESIPILGNERHGIFPATLLRLWPLLILIPAIALWRRRGATRPQRMAAVVFGVVAVLWTLENRPFTRTLDFDQYSQHGLRPYIGVIQHAAAADALCFWSAPEATMDQETRFVRFHTEPYIADVRQTFGHNGLAGVYPDNAKAFLPGQEWDQMLAEYISGRRKVRPVTIGEVDYHGQWELDGIVTDVDATADQASLLAALAEGKSYAMSHGVAERLEIDTFELSTPDGGSAGLGDELTTSAATVQLRISGRRIDDKPGTGMILNVISDGNLIEKLRVPESGTFDLATTLHFAEPGLHYVRLYIESAAGKLVANPMFVRLNPK
jgi:hypothetical protein